MKGRPGRMELLWQALWLGVAALTQGSRKNVEPDSTRLYVQQAGMAESCHLWGCFLIQTLRTAEVMHDMLDASFSQ